MLVNLYGRHPSIVTAEPLPCDLSISINHTGKACDWVCFGDVEEIPHLVTPWMHRVGVIGPASFQYVNPVPSLGSYITWQSLQAPIRTRKSAIMALVAALRFGATEVRTWGIRMEGEQDFDGTPSYDNPLQGVAVRWPRERKAWDEVLRSTPTLIVTRY
jgi:hypothetical protein